MTNFPSVFEQLTGHRPFPWQRELFKRWSSGELEIDCALPTGVGKTSVIAIWLIALAQNHSAIPRRLVYVVNRRTVVDQTSSEVMGILDKMNGSEIEESIRKLGVVDLEGQESPLAVSTLRGQMADNREWSGDPCRPAVIVGTVDMIGSRLLFGGYRIGFKTRPLHAGFLGRDTLLVHDEAHLEPAFQSLLDSIRSEQRRKGSKWLSPPLNLVTLSATLRNSTSDSGRERFSLNDDDVENKTLSRRLHAVKNLCLHSLPDTRSATLVSRMVEIALAHRETGESILIYARHVTDVEKIASEISKGLAAFSKSLAENVATLTGTMRGYERDQLPHDPVFKRFLPDKDEASLEKLEDTAPSKGTVYLVCTSAGEVGVNLSAKHMVCDLTTFESMAQRFGRVNRFGDDTELSQNEQSSIDIVHPEKIPEGKAGWEADYNKSLRNTLKLLENLNGDASLRTLHAINNSLKNAAFSPLPVIPATSDILFDAWSLTTIRETLPGRPKLEPYLHGVTDEKFEPPRTQVVWREEVDQLAGDLLQQSPPRELLESWPIKPHEILHDRSDRVFAELKKVAGRKPKNGEAEQSPSKVQLWVVDSDGQVQATNLGRIVDRGKGSIEGRTIILPPSIGGLAETGLLSGKTRKSDRGRNAPPLDVSTEWFDGTGAPLRFRSLGKQKIERTRIVVRIDLSSDLEALPEEADDSDSNTWYWYEKVWGGDGNYLDTSDEKIHLDDHSSDVAALSRGFATELGLNQDLARALELAGRWHDLGKRRDQWQLSIGNRETEIPLAKSGRGMMSTNLGKFRHELGSIIDVIDDPDFQTLTDELKDLVLHLISVHHGRGRPHFPDSEIFDPEAGREKASLAASEVPLRFERLQRKFGHWELAWLESLLRAADYAASAGKKIREGKQ